MMNKNAKKWIEDLRTTTAGQAKGHLRIGDTYCCLGRACEISQLGAWRLDSNIASTIFSYLGSGGTLPGRVVHWLGLRSHTNDLVKLHTYSASSLNDGGKTFLEIADWLEINQDTLFYTDEELTQLGA